MKGKRISREAALRIGAVALAVAASVAVLPGLLAAPEPPPLAADIGLGASGPSGAAGRLGGDRRPKKGRDRERSPDHDAPPPTTRPDGPSEHLRPRPAPQPPRRRPGDRSQAGASAAVPPPPPPAAPIPPLPVAIAPPAPPPPPAPEPAPGEFGP